MENYFVIGTITGPHALKGEVKIHSTTDFKEDRYKQGNSLYIEKNGQLIEVKVKSHREHKGLDLVSFDGYNSINDIESFKKCKVYVHKDQMQDLDEDEFYYHQLIGCEVIHQEKTIGLVKDIVNYGASDLLIIDQNGKEVMIPFVDEFILDIDTEEKWIEIEVIEGLLDEQ